MPIAVLMILGAVACGDDATLANDDGGASVDAFARDAPSEEDARTTSTDASDSQDGGAGSTSRASDDEATVIRGAAVVLDVLVNDTAEGGVSVRDAPTNGTAAVDPVTGEIAYVHDNGSSDTDSFTYVARTAEGGTTNAATVSVRVTDVDGCDYGPTEIEGTAYPRFPATFSGTTEVSSQEELTAALSSVQAGERIVVEDGSYADWNAEVPASVQGSGTAPVYITAQTMHGVRFTGDSTWTIAGAHIVLAGFERDNSSSYVLAPGSHHVRITSHRRTGGTKIDPDITVPAATSEDSVPHHFEIDNNAWEIPGPVLEVFQCPSIQPECPRIAYGFDIHHNDVRSLDGHTQFLRLGDQGTPTDASQPYDNPKDHSDLVFRNNYVHWLEEQSMLVRSSRNVFRDNFWLNAHFTAPFQHGHDNLMVRNWFEDVVWRFTKFRGWGLVMAFNYFDRERGVDEQAILLNSGANTDGETPSWKAFSTSDGIFSHNVFNNFNYLVGYRERITPSHFEPLTMAAHKPIAEGNAVQNNIVRSRNYRNDWLRPRDGHVTQTMVRSLNPLWDDSNRVETTLTPGEYTTCRNGVVNGRGRELTTHANVLGGAQVVRAPSWW